MEKLVYLLWGPADPARGDTLRDRLLGDTAPAALGGGARALVVNVHDTAAAEAPAPVPTPPGEDPHVAELSVWLDCYERRGPVDEAVGALGLDWACYLVTESLVEDYGTTPHGPARDWPDGERSPGVLTVARIHRPAGLEEAEWLARWHGVQSPLSAELQPRTRYVRNQVVRALSDGAPPTDGVVDEAWPSARHVADPMLFYRAGDRAELDRNVTRMLESVTACLDLTRLRSTTMSEYLVRSLGPPTGGS